MVDDRRIEVLASGLPLYHGAQIAVNATLVSPLTRKGEARARAHRENGTALADAEKQKKTKDYPELATAERCRLVVAGMEVGGAGLKHREHYVVARTTRTCEGGLLCCPFLHRTVWQRPWCTAQPRKLNFGTTGPHHL